MLTCFIDFLSAILDDVAWLQLDDDVDGNHQRGRALCHVEGSLLDIGACDSDGMLMQKNG